MKTDSRLFDLIEKEHQRQLKGIELIASENFVSDDVMKAMGSWLTNKRIRQCTATFRCASQCSRVFSLSEGW